eukprot:GFYU01015078.1.p1 GENE.GFYU01015078.1~~GFYU01015078.1.p1  ORF type:complete len:208 (-),score=35.07 GFYU01015078.1:316-939(-)
MSSEGLMRKGKKISSEDIQLVQNLLERCMQIYMTQNEAMAVLHLQANIEPGLTSLVWKRLEEQNSEFFRAYTLRLKLKDQVNALNEAAQQQARILKDRGINFNLATESMADLVEQPDTPFQQPDTMDPSAWNTSYTPHMPMPSPSLHFDHNDAVFDNVLMSPLPQNFDPGSFLVSPVRRDGQVNPLASPLTRVDGNTVNPNGQQPLM